MPSVTRASWRKQVCLYYLWDPDNMHLSSAHGAGTRHDEEGVRACIVNIAEEQVRPGRGYWIAPLPVAVNGTDNAW
jgi:hypothetical protein